MRVVRLCSVFAPPGGIVPDDPRFDPIGGMQTHTAELTAALDELGVSQTVVTSRPPGIPRRYRIGKLGRAYRVGLPIPVVRQAYALQAAPLVYRAAERADLVHAHLGEDIAVVPIALAAARRYRVPLVLTVHSSLTHTLTVSGPRSGALKVIGGWWERAGVRQASAVITLTSRLARLLTAAGIPDARVHVIPSGVRSALFDAAKTRDRPEPSAPHALFLGRLHRQKGVDLLLRAFTEVPCGTLDLAGDGPERAQLEQLAAELGLTDRVRFLGFVPHDSVPDLLHEADVLVLPSEYEELGTAIVEAMYSGLPVVATRTGGVPELVAHGVNGLLVPPSDAIALAGALRRMLADRDLARRFGERGRARAQGFRWDALAPRVLGVYRDVIAVRGTEDSARRT